MRGCGHATAHICAYISIHIHTSTQSACIRVQLMDALTQSNFHISVHLCIYIYKWNLHILKRKIYVYIYIHKLAMFLRACFARVCVCVQTQYEATLVASPQDHCNPKVIKCTTRLTSSVLTSVTITKRNQQNSNMCNQCLRQVKSTPVMSCETTLDMNAKDRVKLSIALSNKPHRFSCISIPPSHASSLLEFLKS